MQNITDASMSTNMQLNPLAGRTHSNVDQVEEIELNDEYNSQGTGLMPPP